MTTHRSVAVASTAESHGGVAGRHDGSALLTLAPVRAILQLAAPTTAVMLVAAVSNVLYTYYVSRLGTDALAAVSLVFPVSLLAITAMAGGIGSGAASAIARALGASRRGEATTLAEHALVLGGGCGAVFAVGMLVGAEALFRMMGGTGAVLANATLFARVLFGGAVITFGGAMLDSVMRGEGNVRVPAIWSSASLGLQILLTPALMFGAGLGLVGAPLAVLTSQSLAAVPRLRFVFGGRGIVHPAPWPRALAAAPLVEILRVGVPASLSTTINYVGMMMLTAVLARFGDAHLAAYGLGTRLDFLLLSFAYGFGAAVFTLVGMATGARQAERATRYVAAAAGLMVFLMILAGGVVWWRPGWWLGLFTTDPEILVVGAAYFTWIGPSYPFLGAAMVLSFAFQGLGRATAPLLWMIARTSAVVGAAIVGTRWFGFDDHVVFALMAAGNVLSAVALAVLFRGARRAAAHA